MKQNRLFVFAGILVVIFVSCQKEASGDLPGNNNLKGNWKFVSAYATTRSEVQVNDGIDNLSTITYSDYTTIQNAGTFVIDDTRMSYTDLTYAVDDTAKGYVYDNGALVDSLEFPFAYTLPPTSANSSYRRVNADSIYFESGFITSGIAGNTPTIPIGARVKVEGDKMTITSFYNETKTETDQGVTQITINNAVIETRLQKQ